jgi:hypothetical protein
MTHEEAEDYTAWARIVVAPAERILTDLRCSSTNL